MKVYVDELPEKCSKCRFCTSDYYCTLMHRDVFDYDKTINEQTRYSKCSLKTITEHDKQVIKQVCDEIKEKCERTYTISPSTNKPKKEVLIILAEDLNQIQGENNVKD